MRVLDDWLLSPTRAAIHLPTATAVVADLHLGYEKSRHRAGEAVPLMPLDIILDPLKSIAGHARRLVVAGDIFEAGADRDIATEFVAWTEKHHFELIAVVPGNHDRRLASLSGLLPIYTDGFALADWHIVHGDGKIPKCRVVHGHEHPFVRWSPALAGPCFLVGPERLILPAFSRDAAGVNILPGRRWADLRCCVIAGEQVLDFGDLRDLRRKMRKA